MAGGEILFYSLNSRSDKTADSSRPNSEAIDTSITLGIFESTDPFLKELRKVDAVPYEKNAFRDYQLSTFQSRMLFDEQDDIADEIIREGWNEKGEALVPLNELNATTFNRIEEGNAKEAHWVGDELGMKQPAPNYKALQDSAKLFCVMGEQCRRDGVLEEAEQCFLSALKLGSALNSVQAPLISNLVGNSIQKDASRCLMRYMKEEELSEDDLERLSKIIEETIESNRSIDESFEYESHMMTITLKNLRSDLLEKTKNIRDNNSSPETPLPFDVDEATQEVMDMNEEFTAWQLAFSRLPFYERFNSPLNSGYIPSKEYSSAEENPILYVIKGIKVPNIPAADTRFGELQNSLDSILVFSAAKRYQLDHGQFPNQSDELLPDYLTELPVDYFTGKTLNCEWQTSGVKIWSSGPDLKNDLGAIRYDPTNGTMSEGDLIFSE